MRAILIEKVLALALTLGLVAYLSWKQVVLVYIVFGQGHFLLAYLYQFKAGKITKKYVGVALASLVLISTTYFIWPHERALVAVTTIYFLIHMLFDEMYLLRLPMELGRSPLHVGRLLEMCPIFFLYSARVVEALFSRFSGGETDPGRVAMVLSWSALLLLALLLVSGSYRLDVRSAYFLAGGGILIWASYSGWFYNVPTGKLTGFIIIYHYLCWYFHYFLQIQERSRRRTYLNRVVIVNALILSLYFLFGQDGLGLVLFQDDMFYIWTLLHLITSTRPGDLRRVFRFPSHPL